MIRPPLKFATAVMLLAGMATAPAVAGAGDEHCADCHGKDGASTESDIPVIGGVSEQYLLDSMEAYRDSKRPCPETAYRAGDKKRPRTDMCKVASKLSADETAKIAKDLAADPFKRVKQPFDAVKAAVGKKVHDIACEKCHSEGGTAPDDDAGVLAGQPMPWMKDVFAQFTKGARPLPEKMKVKFNALKPDELEALLHYYASQQ